MYLFTRTARPLLGRTRDLMAWSVNVTEKVNQISQTPVNLWTTAFSPGTGTLVWTTVVDDLSTLEATETKLAADDGYLSLADEGAAFASTDPVDDHLIQVLHAETDGSSPAPAYAVVVNALLAPGASVRGIELGIEIAQRAKAITGTSTSFGVGVTGPYGMVTWVTGADSVDQLQRSQEATAADAEFAKLVDAQGSDAYMAGSATQIVYRKIL